MNLKNIIRYNFIVACLFLFSTIARAEKIVTSVINCSATSVSPSSANIPFDGDILLIDVTTPGNCTGYAVLPPSWITYVKTGLIVKLTVLPNTGNARSANVSIGGLTVTVNQDAVCKAASAASSITGTLPVCQGVNDISYSISRISDASSYVWSYTGSGATISGTSNMVTISFDSNATSGILKVKGISSCGLEGISSPDFPITVNATPEKPTITASGPTTFCESDQVTLTSSSGSSYLWSDGETTQSINVTTSGSYTVQVTNSSGCQSIDSDPVTVTVNSKPARPTITVPGSTTFCIGDITELISSSGSGYLWSNGATSRFIEVAESGSYSVQVTNSNGCQSMVSDPVTVTVNSAPKPTIAASGTATFCAGGNVMLTSSSATSYLWSNGATSKSIIVGSSGSYTVQVTDANGCQSVASESFVVTVNALPSQPTITANGPTTFCSFSEVILTSSPGESYLWSTGSTAQSITVESLINYTGNYSVKIADANGCVSSDANPITVTINAVPSQPTITAEGPTTLCAGASVILTSSPETSYLWSTGETTRSITVNSAGSYTVQVTNSNGCQSASSDAVAVTINPAPNFTLSNSWPLCEGNTITLNGPNGMSSYAWHGPNNATGRSQNLNISSASAALSSGTYTLIANNGYGCSNSASIYIEVNTLPTITVSNTGPVCEGGMLNFAGPAGMTNYFWNGPNGFSSSVQNPTIPNASVTMSGTYTLTETDANGCSNSTQTYATVNVIPVVTASNNGPVCEGNTITLTGLSGLTTYAWTGPNNFTSSSQNISLSDATLDMSGTYTLTGTRYGCSNSSTTIVNVNAFTPIVLPDNKIVYEGSALSLAAPGGFASYSWTGPAGFTSSSQNPAVSASATSVMSGTYSLTTVNNGSCASQASTNITVRAYDKSLSVGSTAGAFNVSSSGAASYQIPIFVSPGTGGMAPSLSATYNSQAGNGLLGLGWNLSGLSAITRLPQTLKDDGKVEAVQLSSSDPFGLDGNRLVVTNEGIYGADGTEYHTQAETFVRVTSYGSSGSGPRWFKVETKDGKTIEYGNSETSYLQAANKDEIIFWHISKITDANGNYITFTYHTDKAKGEFWPVKIDYTGNSNTGLTPYNSINFSYQTRPDANTTYVAGSGIAHNVLLNNIQTVSEGIVVREYDFNFPQNSSLLNEVVEYGTDHTKINATTIGWPENAKNTDAFLTNFSSSTGYLFDDFNGDGKKEIFSQHNNHVYEINDARTGFSDLGSSGLPEFNNDGETGDFNGDGKSDVIVPLFEKSNAFAYYKSIGNSFTFVGNYGFATSVNGVRLYPGDYNGDGLTDLIARNPDDGSLTIFWGDPVSPFSNSSSITTIAWGDKQYFADFNGDGKIDVMTLDLTGYKIYEYKNSAFQLTQSNSQPNSKFDLYLGDFNGDGKSDFIYDYIGNNYKINISTGTNFIVASQSLLVGTFNHIWVGDMNGDGRDEFVGDIAAYAWKNNSLVICGSNDGPEAPTVLFIQDFDGDGTMDCLWTDCNPMSECLLHAQFNFGGNVRHLVSSITNGLNNTVSLTYKPLTDNTVHTKLTDGSYRSIDIAPSWLAVSSVQLDNGIGGQNELNYHYTGAKFDNRDGQFLGFSCFTQTNSTSGLVSNNYYDIDKTYYFSKPTKSEVKTTAGTSLTETSYSTTVKDFGDNRLFIYQDHQTSIDHLHGDATTTSTMVYNDDGNPTRTTTNAGGIATVETTNTFTATGTNAWCPNKLETTSSKHTRTGETDYTTANSYTYYPNGLLKQQIAEPGNAKQVYTNYTYNDFGNVTQVKVSPDGITGRVTNLQYESDKGRMVTQRSNVYGHYIDFSYDYGLGVATETKDHNNLTTISQYDHFGRLLNTANSDGTSSGTTLAWVTGTAPQYAVYYSTSYASGQPDVITYFDRLGRPLQSETTGFSGQKLITETHYNTKGQVDYVTLPYYEGESNADRKSYTYDPLGRVVTEKAPGLDLTYAYNGLSTTVTNNLNGQSTTKTADASGCMVQSRDNGGTISYTYNAMGQVRQVTTPWGNNTMGYDQFGRQTYLKDPNAGGMRYDYNVYGELLSQTDTLSNFTNLQYDNIGRVFERDENSLTTNWVYNANGRLDSQSAIQELPIPIPTTPKDCLPM